MSSEPFPRNAHSPRALARGLLFWLSLCVHDADDTQPQRQPRRFFKFALIPPFSAFFAHSLFSQISYNIGMFAQRQRPPMQLAQTAFALFYFLF